MKIVVTGGAGFIGSALVGHLISHTDHEVLVVDKLTYAGNLASLSSVQGHPRYRFSHSDICDRAAIASIFCELRSRRSHAPAPRKAMSTDRSTGRPNSSTPMSSAPMCLLEAALAHWRKREAQAKDFRFLHVSTDEVFGALTDEGHFTEESVTIRVRLIRPPRQHPTIW